MVKKLVLDIDEETWQKVQIYKIQNKLPSNNQAVVELVNKGLDSRVSEKAPKTS